MLTQNVPEDRFNCNPENEAEKAELVFKAKSQHMEGDPVRSEHLTPRSFLFYKKSVTVRRDPYLQSKPPAGSRKKIFQFSEKSKRKLRHTALNSAQDLSSQFCLTYHNKYPQDGQEVKAHLNRFLNKFRRKFKGFSYLWILEFQTRGAAHFHLFSSVPVNDFNRNLLADMWADIVDPQDQTLRDWHKNPRNFINWDMGNGQYLCKYLDKEAQKAVPEAFQNVGRFWGCTRGIVAVPTEVRDKYITEHLAAKIDQPVKVITRWLAKWHENKVKRASKGKSQSKIRRTPNSYTIANGAKQVFLQIIEYISGLPNLPIPLPF